MKKVFILAIIFSLMIFSVAQANNIAAKLFFNEKIVQEFDNDTFEIKFKDFFKSTCRLRLKNNLNFDFKPKVRIIFRDNWGTTFEDKKNLPAIIAGKSLDFDIEMKNYLLKGRKNTSAWLQIWLIGEKNIFSENYFCIRFNFSDYLIGDKEE